MKLKYSFKRIIIGFTWLWLVFFALLPHFLVFLMSLGNATQPDFMWGYFSFSNYFRLLDFVYLKVFLRSIVIAAICTGVCLLIAYPFAYLLSRLEGRYKSFFLLLVMIPFWTSSLMRTYAIITMLKSKGIINSLLLYFKLIEKPLPLLYTPFSMLLGLVYTFLPLMILPLYLMLEHLDERYLEAARDLGATKSVVFFRVLLPLTWPGIGAGTLLVFLPAMSLFYIADMLGGSKSLLLGNLIQDQFLLAHDWPFGSALSMVLIFIMVIMIRVYTGLRKKYSEIQQNFF